MILTSQRHLFEIPDEICYLNCAYMSPQLRDVREAGERAVAKKSRPWEITPADFFADADTARQLFAEIVGGDAEGVAIVPSASYGVAVAAANVGVRAGQNILVLEEQFPSNVYAWMQLANERDAKVLTVPRPADGDWTAAVLQRIDGDTAVVAVPNCHWTDGSLLDLVRVGAAARAAGAALVVDATQSLGACPLDIDVVRPDFLVAAAYKWLLGPYSVGFLYVDEAWRAGKPLEHNWIARAGSRDFGSLVLYQQDFEPGARRFDVGERSNFALLPMAIAAMRQILAWEVPHIADTIGAITRLIEGRAQEAGIGTPSSAQRAPHLIGLQLGDAVPADFAERLSANKVYLSVRGDRLRVAPHVYNTADDVDRLFSALT